MHYASVNLIRHKKLQGLAERFASSVILCPSNQSLLDEGGGERTWHGGDGEKFIYFFVKVFAGVSPFWKTGEGWNLILKSHIFAQLSKI